MGDQGYGQAVNDAQARLDQGDMAQQEASQVPIENNPVMKSLETIGKFAQSLEQKQDPKGAAIIQALQALIQAMSSSGGQLGAPQAPSIPPEAAGAPPPMSPGEEMVQKPQPQIM